MIITNRDVRIFNLVCELGFASSDTIRDCVSPKTKRKTFNLRLSSLKKEGFIREMRDERRIRNQHSIFSVGRSKNILNAIRSQTGVAPDISAYNTSYRLFLHRLRLGRLFSAFLKTLRVKTIETPSFCGRLFGSKSVRKEIRRFHSHKAAETDYLDAVVIPDLTFLHGNTAFLFELENANSYRRFQNKIRNYEEMLLKKDAQRFFPIFRGKGMHLIVSTRLSKKRRYEEILAGYSGKRTLISIEKLLSQRKMPESG